MRVFFTWRIAVALLLIVALSVALALVLWPEVSEQEAVDTVTPSTLVIDDRPIWEEAARSALDAWAEFASSGDLDGIDEWFAQDGPQHAQIVDEAASFEPSGSDSYLFELSDVEHEARDGFPVVSGRVTVTVNGEITERLDWDIYLVARGDRWVVWTVDQR